jgi:F-type H+-transporting ATPase subunit b
MPQISQLAATYASQIFWLLLTFGFVFFVIGLGIVPRVQGTMDTRDRSVADDLAAAEAARVAADATEERWRAQENAAREAAQKLLAEARERGAKASEVTLGAANATLNAQLADNERRIAAASAAASAEIEAVAADAAQAIVARLSNAEVSAAEAQQAVKGVLAHG